VPGSTTTLSHFRSDPTHGRERDATGEGAIGRDLQMKEKSGQLNRSLVFG
jgi:hypothetical protein